MARAYLLASCATFFGCSASTQPAPDAATCLSTCEAFVAECGAPYDCDELCRELVTESDEGEFGCSTLHFGPFVDCLETSALSCASCDREEQNLRSCNAAFCAMLPATPGCALPALVTSCGPENTDLPPYDRECTQESGCGLFFHQTDCCGTTVAAAYGSARGVQNQVLAAEEACREMIPVCRCAAEPLRDEEGTLVGPGDTVSAICEEGRCRALVE